VTVPEHEDAVAAPARGAGDGVQASAHPNRRRVLGWALAAGATGAALSAPGVRDLVEAARRTASASDVTVLWANLTRPQDQLSLRWELVNLRLYKAGEAGPGDQSIARLAIADATQPAFVVVHFPAQNLAEHAFEEVDPNFPGQAGDETGALTTPVPAALANESRLAFAVPWDIDPIPFTPESLLGWEKFTQSVVPAAVRKVMQRPGPQEPLRSQTAIEAPWGVVISPDDGAGWAHASAPVVHGDRTELWHTRLGVRQFDPGQHRYTVDEQDPRYRSVRAVWTPGFVAAQPPPPGTLGPNPPDRTSLTPRQRYEIVRLSSDYSIDAGNADGANPKPYVPQPIAVNRLMLSSLGAWLDTDGSWDTPVRPVGMREALTVQQWVHRATMGRDHYVKVVQAGFLFPFGHRASLITITERKFQPVRSPRNHPQFGKLAAFNRQRMYLVVRETERGYPDDLPFQPSAGRAMPLKTVRIVTPITPSLAAVNGTNVEPLTKILRNPADPASFFGTDAFWPVVASSAGPQDFQFAIEAEDARGQRCHFTAPLIFVGGAVSDDVTATDQIAQQYGTAAVARRERPLGGQRLVLSNLPGDSTYPVNSITLGSAPPDPKTAVLDYRRQPRFFPVLSSTSVRLDAVERVKGAPAGDAVVAWHDDYLTGKVNPGQVFAKLVNPIDLAFGADAVGGVVTPNLRIGGLSTLLGPLGGDLTGPVPVDFDPVAFFAGAAPMILGALPLPAILVKAAFTAIDRIPKLVNADLPDAMETSLTWNPVVKADDNNIFAPADPNNTLMIQARARVPRSGGAPTVQVTGDLTNFALNVFGTGDLGLLTISFNRLRFTARDGRKPTVDVDIAGVRFHGILSFINPLQDFLASTGLVPGLPARAPGAPGKPGGAGAPGPARQPLAAPGGPPPNGPDITVTADGIRAGYTLALPRVAVGAFSLENIALSSALNIPFVGGPARVRFAFSERERPFLLTVAMFGGGGFCALELGLDGFERFEAALEFGARFSLDLGVASGGVSAMAGVYFALTPTNAQLTGYVRINGELSVLGLVSLGLEFYLGLTYDSGTGELYGQAKLTVSVEIAFFSTSVTLGPIEKRFAGGGSGAAAPHAVSGPRHASAAIPALPPAVSAVMSRADWADPVTGYCALFAPAAFAV
jgi:hypothetical protein